MDHPPSIKAAFRRRESQSGRRSDPGQHLLREISGQYQISKLEIYPQVASSDRGRGFQVVLDFHLCIHATWLY